MICSVGPNHKSGIIAFEDRGGRMEDMHLKRRLGLARLSNELLGIQSGNTTSAGTGDSLAVTLVLNITAGEDTLDGGVAGTRLGENVAILIELDLLLDEGIGGVVTNGVEQTVGLDKLLLAGNSVLDTEVGHQTIRLVLANNFGSDGVEADNTLGVGKEAVSHDLGGTELVTTNKDGDTAAILGQEHGLLGSGVTTTDHVERLVAEDRDSTVADSAGTDTVLPVSLLTRQVQTTGVGTGSDDDGVGGTDRLAARGIIPLGPHLEGALRKIQLGDSLGNDLGTEALRLLAHLLHQLLAADTVGEAREVLDISGSGELATGSGAIGKHTLIEDRLEFSTRQVNGGSVGGGARSDNCGKGKKMLDQSTACFNQRGKRGGRKLTDNFRVHHSGVIHAIDARGRR